MIFEFFVPTKHRQECVSLVSEVNGILKNAQAGNGLCHVFVHHTTAALTIVESADPNIHKDLFKALNSSFPQHADYLHDKIDNNAQSHILGALVGPAELIPVKDGKLGLGTWQDLVLVEFDGPRERRITVTMIADSEQ